MCDKCFHTPEDHNQHELTHSNKKVHLQQEITEKEYDTASHNGDQGKGCQTEWKANVNHTEHDSCNAENRTYLCNDEQIGAVEKPCPEQSLSRMEHELHAASNEDYLSQPNVDTENIEQASWTSEDHSKHEQCDTS